MKNVTEYVISSWWGIGYVICYWQVFEPFLLRDEYGKINFSREGRGHREMKIVRVMMVMIHVRTFIRSRGVVHGKFMTMRG